MFDTGELQEIFIIKHMGKNQDNPHFHMALKSTLTTQTLRARLKKYYTCKGNETLSVKKWDGKDKFIQYCLHECKTLQEVNDNLLLNTMPSVGQEELGELLKKHLTMSLIIKENRPKKVMIEIYEKLDMNRGYTDQCLFQEIMRYYIAKGDWLPNKFQAERYLNYLKMMIAEYRDSTRDDSMNMDYFIKRLYENYFLRI